MADKRINDLPVGGQVQDNDLFVIQRNGTAYSVKGEDVGGGGGGATWGSITGTLSNQTDLNTALGGKASQTDLTATQNSLQALWLLNEGQTYDIHDVTQSAYENIVGAGCKWDTTKMIGGKSLVWNQLANPIASATIKGVSVTSSNGLFTVAGTAIDGGGRGVHWTELVPLVNGHKFALLVSLTQFTNFFIQNTGGEYVSASPNSIFTLDKSSGSYGISANFVNATVYNDSGYIMLIDLTQAGLGDLTTVAQVRAILPNAYYPYSAGEIKSAVVDRVDVRGKNLCPNPSDLTYSRPSDTTYASTTKRIFTSGTWVKGLTYENTYVETACTASVSGDSFNATWSATNFSAYGFGIVIDSLLAGNTYTKSQVKSGGISAVLFYKADGTYISYTMYNYFTVPNETACSIILFTGNASLTSMTVSNIQLELGSTETAYSPYSLTQTNIPASIQALEGYGRSAGTAYNYVDYDTKTYHKRVGSVDLGSLTWIKEDIGTLIRFKTTGLSFSGSRDFICRLYYTGAHTASSLENLEMYGSSNSFYVRNDTYSQYSGENFKNNMSGVILYYALPTEVVTDISSLIPNNFLKNFSVEEGGAITLHNTNGDSYRIPVPNTQGYGDGIDRFEPLETDVNNINEYLGFVGSKKIVGVCADFENRTFTRLAGAYGKTAGASFNSINAFGGRRRCNVADNGTINAYYGDASYTEDGSNGQVMVYQPKFYYKVTPMKLEANTTGLGYHLRKANYYVCDTPVDGFKLHPAFYDANGHEVDYILLSAYEGSMWDASESKYINDSVDTSIAYATGDLLCSVAGKKPISGLRTGMGTKAIFESMANNRGTGWHLETIKATSLNQLLMVIEYGMFNMQTGIGQGVVSITDNSSYNCSSLTGSTASLGNASGNATSTTNEIGGTETIYTVAGKLAVSYRGVENAWGNIWKHIQGVNIWGDGSMAGGQPFVCDDLSSFNESSHSEHYEGAGFTIPNAGGYIKAMGYGNPDFDWLLMPSEIGGNSSLPVGDYCYVTANLNGYRIALLGGYWGNGVDAGGFCWSWSSGVGYRERKLGGRLLYVPTAR